MKAVVGIALASMAGSAMAADVAPEASTDRALKVGYANETRGDFEYEGDRDSYRVYLKKGINYGFRVLTPCLYKSVALYDKGFRPLAQSAVTSSYFDSWIERTVPYSGFYYVQVRSEHTPPDAECAEPGQIDTDYYMLSAVQSCAPNRTTTCASGIGTTGIRRIWAPADRSWSYFDVKTPGTYRIAALPGDADHPWEAGGYFGLRDPKTNRITERLAGEFAECSEGEACLQQKLTKPGRYYVTLRMPWMSMDSGPTRYRIHISKVD